MALYNFHAIVSFVLCEPHTDTDREEESLLLTLHHWAKVLSLLLLNLSQSQFPHWENVDHNPS